MRSSGLPVEEVIGDVRLALTSNSAAVLVAPPGSGKTTVVPLALLEAIDGRILLLEPRRLATRAAARRMASLLGEEVGETIGYVTRTDRRVGRHTRLEVVTEGILTRRLQSDPELPGVGLVIFDEAHERNLQTDLGLALTLDVRNSLRPDLAVLIMSATIDPAPVSALLGGAPVVEAKGSLHEVDVRWTPPPPRQRRTDQHTAAVVRRALEETEGDVLVFLPGMAEIRRVQEALTGVLADVRILHGSIPPEEQDLALAPSIPPFRKVVLSTDIAESSLTVEGVTAVVDTGVARSPRFDPRTGMTRLQTVPISRASADQRAGRAGRLGPGVAYRLWSKMEHATRRPDIQPEIRQVDLAGLVLELAAWGTSDPAELRWLDPPPEPAWNEAVELLEMLGALEDGRITEFGRSMARLPVHPRVAAMIAGAGPDAALAVWMAVILEERDPLRGDPRELPVDIAIRVRLLADRGFRHPAAVPAALHRLRDMASDLADRAGVSLGGEVDLDRAGPVLARAFPDRLAVRRGSPGRFQMRTGTTAVIPPHDPLATEDFVVAADLDGKRRDARIRLAAAIDGAEVAEHFVHEIDQSVRLVWEGERLVERTERRLGGMVLDSRDQRPEPGERTVRALLGRIRDRGLDVLPWTRESRELCSRVSFLHRTDHQWPDWTEAGLAQRLEEWLGPYLVAATGWDDVTDLDLMRILRSELGHSRWEQLEREAPSHLTLPNGRRVRIDYSGGSPVVSVRVQDVFGLHETPRVGGRPVVLELLSPANRPIQVTSDLEGFWKGSWQQVRKEMAGRYPKHPWPEHP